MSGPTVALQAGRGKVGYKRKSNKKSSRRTDAFDKLANFASDKDEYGDGPVSGVASAVAQAGGMLSQVPIIGPFARATEIGAGAISRVAKFFGFTNVPVISDVQPFKDLPFGGFASSELSAPTPKLALDPKNELTLDSRTVGLDGVDELSLKAFVGRESYLGSFDWDQTNAPGETLFTCFVQPSTLFRRRGSTIWPTPLSHVCQLYSHWSGSIVFRFKIAASKYHRGRIKIQFEPQFLSPSDDPPNDVTNITRIYDIAADDDIEVIIPWMQNQAYQPNSIPSATPEDSEQSFTAGVMAPVPSSITHPNGFFTISVANELTSSSANSPVSIAAFVKAGDDFELLGPRTPTSNYTWLIQSAECATNPLIGTVEDMMGDTEVDIGDTNLVYGGETAVSLRQLLHRHCFVNSVSRDMDSDGALVGRIPGWPLSPSYTSSTKNVNSDFNANLYNYAANTFVSWLSPCFAGRRGSIYWAANVSSSADWTMAINRVADRSADFFLPSNFKDIRDMGIVGDSEPEYFSLISDFHAAGNGTAVYNSKTQSGVTFLLPYISNTRFSGTYPSNYTDEFSSRFQTRGFGFSYEMKRMNTGGDPRTHIDWYCAAGPDFNLFFFSGIPAMTIGAPPVPVQSPP